MRAHVCGICEGCCKCRPVNLCAHMWRPGGLLCYFPPYAFAAGSLAELEMARYHEASVNFVPVTFSTVVEVVIYSCTWDFPWLLKIRI